MSPRMLPKTLAKTLAYVACTAPSEYGLFWNSDGTMPWKEFYWVLQDDPQLRFVREATIRELELIGLDLPFTLQSGQLRAKNPDDLPQPAAVTPPPTLYYWARRKQLRAIRQDGLVPDGARSYVALFSDRDAGWRRARYRDPQPMLVTIAAGHADQAGIQFFNAGPEMFLCFRIPMDYLAIPLISDEPAGPGQPRGKRERNPVRKAARAPTPGSFWVSPEQLSPFHDDEEAGIPANNQRKRDQGPGWKRESRKERHKREIDRD